MTREEAIADIRDNIKPVVGGKSLDMAIKALEQEPCTDAISRQAVLEVIRKCHCEEWVKADIGAPIEALQSVNPAEKQEPCADAISRQAVLNLAKFDGRDGLGSIIHAFDVEQLPPVKPQYTDAEIQKMQDLESAEIQKAYEIGKEEGRSENPNKWIPVSEKYEHHIDHTDCIWYGDDSGCPVTCSQYRDGWNDAMDYIFKNGDGYRPYRRDENG